MTKYNYEKKLLKNLLGSDMYDRLKSAKAILAGGAITSLFTRKKINDFDIYFRSEDDILKFIDCGWHHHSMSKKAVMISSNSQLIQLIFFKYFSNAQEIFESFDYTINMGAFDFSTEEFIIHDDFFYANTKKILHFNTRTAFPIVSAIRLDKYIQRGYAIPNTDIANITLACMAMEINTWGEFKEQVGGMYGTNIDDVFDHDDDEKFDIFEAMSTLSELELYEPDLKEMDIEKSQDLSQEAVMYTIIKDQVTFVKEDGYYYGFNKNDKMVIKLNSEKSIKSTDKIVTPQEFFADKLVYKNVQKLSDGRYVSYYDGKFEYKLGKEVFANRSGYKDTIHSIKHNSYVGNSEILFFHTKGDILGGFYSNNEDKVIIECAVLPEDYAGMGQECKLRFARCIPLREVSVAELEGKAKDAMGYGFTNFNPDKDVCTPCEAQKPASIKEEEDMPF